MSMSEVFHGGQKSKLFTKNIGFTERKQKQENKNK